MADRDPELRVVAASRRSGRSGLTVGAALSVLLALIVGLVVGRATRPSHDSPRSPRSASDTGPARSVSGVPLGYARTREGAVAAALSYGVVSARADFLNPSRRAAVLRLIATPVFA